MSVGVFAFFFLYVPNAKAQRVRGELRIEVRDAQGATVAPSGELASEANEFRRTFVVGADGRHVAQDLPFGVYRLSLHAEGFAPWSELVENRSEVPVHLTVTLGVAPLTTQVQVNDTATLVDPNRTGTLYTVGRQAIGEQAATQPGRDLLDLVADQPGWLLEANGVLHPRGSEYDVQFVVDGLPMTQNRSPAFAPAFDADDVESLRVITANFPAEYGRKLGGIVELTTQKDVPAGLHGQLNASGGSFSTVNASAGLSFVQGQNHFSASGDGFHTARYLDPPVLQNFTNRGNAGGFSGSYERDFSGGDRLRVTVTHNAVRFLVPDELVQQIAGQRQRHCEYRNERADLFSAPHLPRLVLEFFRQRARRERGAALERSGNPGHCFSRSRISRRIFACGPGGASRASRLEDRSGRHLQSGARSTAVHHHESESFRSRDPTAISICRSPLGRRAFRLCAGSVSPESLERKRRAALRSLWICGAGIGLEPASGSFAICSRTEFAAARCLRSRVPNAGNRKLAAGQFPAA